MKTEDAERIVKLLADSLGQGKEFVLAQAPDVVQQLVMWERLENIGLACILATLAMVAGRVAVRAWRAYHKQERWQQNDGLIAASVILGATCVTACVGACVHSGIALRWFVAPKLAILEWAMRLV